MLQPHPLEPPAFTCERIGAPPGEARLHLTGSLDIAAAPEFKEMLREAWPDAQLIVADLRELDFMDCTGMRVIVNATKRAREDGHRLVVLRGPERVDRVFTLTRTCDVVEIADRDPRGLSVVASAAG